MKPILFGAVVGLVWLLFDAPLVTVTAVLAAVVQPVTVAFVLGLLARPYVARRGWLR